MVNKIIAVYGTLRNGYGNHTLIAGCEYLGTFKTKPEYTMIGTGIPFVLPNGGTAITVECYHVVDHKTLRSLDSLEGHPDWYTRTPIELPNGMKVEMYVMNKVLDGHVRVMGTGNYADYYQPYAKQSKWYKDYYNEEGDE